MLIEAGQSRFLDIVFDTMTINDAAARVRELSQAPTFSYIVTPNVDHILTLQPASPNAVSKAFQTAYAHADLCLCDSKILQKLAQWKDVALNVVAGSDLTAHLFQQGHFDNRKVAIIGGDSDFLPELEQLFPKVSFIQHHPPMGLLHNPGAQEEIVKFVREARADFTLFAFGSPQSEILAHQCKQDGHCTGVGLCIGASIEFLLGRKKRAPKWLQTLRLEWAFRLLSEPGRLWKRYLVTGPRIFLLFFRWRAS
jgi:N-acetylglucosaminyldiphosphoundecaprenol N-acetyl-beta-D-mannosaminyltransferase